MLKTHQLSALVNTLIIVVVFFVIVALAPREALPIRGIILPLTTTPVKMLASTDPDDIQVYTEAAQPSAFQKIARIDLERHFEQIPNDVDEGTLLSYAKALAAQHGANGLVIQLFGHSEGAEVPGLNIYALKAIAIRTNTSPRGISQ